MRLFMKVLLAPVILLLAVVTWLCAAVLYCSSYLFGLIGTLLGILGVAFLVLSSVRYGGILLVLAFLAGPLGIPMAAAWLVGKIQDLRYAIQDRVYG